MQLAKENLRIWLRVHYAYALASSRMCPLCCFLIREFMPEEGSVDLECGT